MIAGVVRWSNGMVMVFDGNGQQLPDYQGPIEEVRDKILRDAPESATFEVGDWNAGLLRPIPRGEF